MLLLVAALASLGVSDILGKESEGFDDIVRTIFVLLSDLLPNGGALRTAALDRRGDLAMWQSSSELCSSSSACRFKSKDRRCRLQLVVDAQAQPLHVGREARPTRICVYEERPWKPNHVHKHMGGNFCNKPRRDVEGKAS